MMAAFTQSGALDTVRWPSTQGRGDSWIGNDASGAMTVRVPERQYWMDMKKGHSYELRIGTTAVSDTARVTVTALERDQNGNVTRRFEAGRGCG
jgi:hypothetical protein